MTDTGELTSDYLYEWAAQRQASQDNQQYEDRCEHCWPHGWHGVICGKYGCTCATSFREGGQ